VLKRRLAAILAADVVGFSRLMGRDEEGTLTRLKRLRSKIVEPSIRAREGRIVKVSGDGLISEFPSVVDATDAAISILKQLVDSEPEQPKDNRIQLRVGIHIGDVIVEGSDIYGDGVNVAARLEALADPNSICVSEDVYRQARGKVTAEFLDLGIQELKNIAYPLRVYRIEPGNVALANQKKIVWSSERQKPSIAILPFDNMSTDPEQDYLADGLTEDLITALSRLPRLHVVARNSTFVYKGKQTNIQQVGRELSVRYVLEGSVRRSGNRLRITAQLLDSQTGLHLWAERYDRELADIFELQDDITKNVCSALQVTLTDGEQARLRASGTDSLKAWEFVVQAMDIVHSHRKSDVKTARHLAEQAISLDPNYGWAWIALGFSHWEEAFNGWSPSPDQSLAEAERAARKGLEIDPYNTDILSLLGVVQLSRHEFSKATETMERAMEIGPTHSQVWGVAGVVAVYSGDADKALILIERAMSLSPFFPAWMPETASQAHLLAGRTEQALSWAEKSVEIEPNYVHGLVCLVVALCENGRDEEARSIAKAIIKTDPGFAADVWARGQPFHDPAHKDLFLHSLQKVGL
jgi:adenylate cyclase